VSVLQPPDAHDRPVFPGGDDGTRARPARHGGLHMGLIGLLVVIILLIILLRLIG
jgi:hypothetical protein